MNGQQSNALVTTPTSYSGMTLAVAPVEAKRRLQELQAFIQEAMVPEEDFGVIPGTDKPSLLQPGAQKLAEIYGLAHRFEAIETVKDWDRGFFYFEYRCLVSTRRDGQPVSEGIGSCNSKESKYAARWVFENEIPAGMNKATLRSKEVTSRKNGRKFTMYQVPNPDPYSLVNTIQKMAAKRSYVMAIIAATRSAGLFTQDREDDEIPAEAYGAAESTRSWEQGAGGGEPDFGAAAAAKLRASLAAAGTLEELRTAWGGVGVAHRAKWISRAQYDDLVSFANERKADLERMTPTSSAAPRPAAPGPQAAGADPSRAVSEAPPTCLVCGKPAAVHVQTPGGARHPACDPKSSATIPTAAGPACWICRKATDPATAVTGRDPKGAIAFRHPGCMPPAPAERQDDGEPPDDYQSDERQPGED